jgi:hypothetical protein
LFNSSHLLLVFARCHQYTGSPAEFSQVQECLERNH